MTDIQKRRELIPQIVISSVDDDLHEHELRISGGAMEILAAILTSVASNAAAHIGRSIFLRLKDALYAFCRDSTDEEIRQALDQIGNLTEADVRRRVEEFAQKEKIAAPQAEELTNLLLNLARGVNFHTTQGTPRSSFLRCERFLDQLLASIQPCRLKGDAVAENGMPGWKLTRFLGMGSFGEVWEARSPHYPETRAIKFFTSLDAQKWIAAEQQTLFHVRSRLPKHSNLISFLDVAITGKPYPYLVLEYVNGGSLEDWLLAHDEDRESLEKRLLVDGIVRGLSEAHQNGITHGDLKPANILLSVGTGDVVPKIADFGLGNVEARRGNTSASSQGILGGTTMYLPPEALQQFAKRSPHKDDIFAVGVVWYQILVGKMERPPYDFAYRLRDHLVDSQTIRVIERCLAQPERRYKDASELEQDLENVHRIPDWDPPADCFDVQHLGREFLASKA